MGSTLRHPGLIGIPAALALLLSLAPQAAFGATATSDVSLTLAVDHATVRMGQDIHIVATMTNHGPNDATFVDTVFTWPGQLTLVSETCDKGISPDTPFCEYSNLAAGETVVSVLTLTPGPGPRRGGRRLTIRAAANFEVNCSFDPNCTFDPNGANNSAWVRTKFLGKA